VPRPDVSTVNRLHSIHRHQYTDNRGTEQILYVHADAYVNRFKRKQAFGQYNRASENQQTEQNNRTLLIAFSQNCDTTPDEATGADGLPHVNQAHHIPAGYLGQDLFGCSSQQHQSSKQERQGQCVGLCGRGHGSWNGDSKLS
jgi:hypothetical protein